MARFMGMWSKHQALISGSKVRALVRPPSKSKTYQYSPFEARRLKRFFKRRFLARRFTEM
jgi:hypothetical protein